MLDEEDAWERRPDPRAFDYLFKLYERLVGASIKRIAGAERGDRKDLEQEGRIGLLKAIAGFDPNCGKRFASYAVPWIRGAIEEYLRSPAASWVKRSGQDAAKRLEKARAALSAQGLEQPTEDELATELGIDLATLPAFLDKAILPSLGSLDAASEDEEHLADRLPDPSSPLLDQVYSLENEALIERAIRRLPAKGRAVFRGRVERGMTAKEVGTVLGISPREVNNIQEETLSLLRRYLNRVKGRLAHEGDDKKQVVSRSKQRGRRAGKQLSTQLTCYLTPEEREWAERLAEERRCSLNRVMREALREAKRRAGCECRE